MTSRPRLRRFPDASPFGLAAVGSLFGLALVGRALVGLAAKAVRAVDDALAVESDDEDAAFCWCVNERTHRRDEPCPERDYWLDVEDSEL